MEPVTLYNNLHMTEYLQHTRLSSTPLCLILQKVVPDDQWSSTILFAFSANSCMRPLRRGPICCERSMICRDGKIGGAPLATHTLAKGGPVRQQEGKHP